MKQHPTQFSRRPVVVESLESRQLMASVPGGFVDRTVVTGLATPTSAEVLPDGRVLVTEKQGTLRVIKGDKLLAKPALKVNVVGTTEQGLLSVVADPEFSTNGHIYIYFTAPGTPSNARVVRYTLAGDVVKPGSRKKILDLDPMTAPSHVGGGMHFGADGKLYIATGENATPERAQSLDTLHGKILRINKDGTIPTDNPFYDTAEGKNRAIWALGLRNPFSFAFQPGTGRMLINDVGNKAFEEINEGKAGANYGWPETEGPTTDPRFEAPIYAYTQADGSRSITAGVFYNPSGKAKMKFPKRFVGNYFFTDFRGDYIKRMQFAQDGSVKVSTFATDTGTMVDMDLAPDGSVYYVNFVEGRLGRIRFTGGAAK